MMSELKGKSVKETLKKLGAKTLPAKPGKGGGKDRDTENT
jgi:hypothetical protein